jgi:hypothetical protein
LTTRLDAYEGLTADEHKAIRHGNAWTLFPHLAPPRDTMTAGHGGALVSGDHFQIADEPGRIGI